jgi:hypothetical protein
MNESLLKYAVTAEVTAASSPAFDLAAVRSRAALGAPVARPRRNRSWLVAALVIGVPSLALAASQIIPARFSWMPNGAVLISAKISHDFLRPTPNELARIVQGAHYPVVLPTGLPAGSKLRGLLMAVGTESFVVSYRVPGRGQCCVISFLITPLSSAPIAHSTFPPGDSIRFAPKAQTHHAQWNAGVERVTVVDYTISLAQLSHIRNAMIAKGKAQANP